MDGLKLIVHEHITHRRQMLILAKSDLIKTYSGAALGWAWAIIQPVITIFTYWFGIAIGLKAGKNAVEGYPYLLWLTSGMIPWFYMSSCLTGGTGYIRKYKFLVKKMKFPISIIPTFCNLSQLYVQAVLLIMTIIMFAIAGFFPTIYYLQLPIYILMMFAFFSLWGIFAGILSCICKDVSNFIRTLTRFIFWTSGIFFSIDRIPNPVIKAILNFNPIAIIVTGYRNCFINHKWFFEDPTPLIEYGIMLVIVLALAVWAFKRLRKEIPDVI